MACEWFASSGRTSVAARDDRSPVSVSWQFLILLSSPISLALGLASTIAAADSRARGRSSFLPQKIYTALDSFPLLAVPLFILAGSFLETGGVGRRLVNLANVMVRHYPGGLGMVVVVATMIFSEVSGSSAADAAAIGSVTIPAMLRLGYTPAFATAVVAAAGGAPLCSSRRASSP